MKKRINKDKNRKTKQRKSLGEILKLKMPAGYDMGIHACIIILLIFGSIMVVSTSVGESTTDHMIVYKTIIKQTVFVILSYVIMSKVALHFMNTWIRFKDKRRFEKLMDVIGGCIILMLLACQAFSGANGSKAWIYLPGNISIQPSEFAKAFYIVIFGMQANYYYHRRYDDDGTKMTFWKYMKRPLIYLFIFIALIGLQPDFGTIIVLTLIAVITFFIPGNRCLWNWQRIIKILFICGAVLIILLFFTNPGLAFVEKFIGGYKLKRLTDAADPFKNIYDTGYNLVYSLYAIANGGIMGLGFGASEQKFGYLPEAQTDFILSVTIEELGIWGLMIIVSCYGLILYRLIYYAKVTQSDGYRIILVGTALYLSLHFVFNVGGVSGLLPLTGVPLLFMSAGGSSLLSITALLGVCQSIISKIKLQNSSYRNKGLLGKSAYDESFGE